MKRKVFLKKSIAIVMIVFAFFTSMSLTSSATTIIVPNKQVNVPDKIDLTDIGTIDGYITTSTASDYNYAADTMAGKLVGTVKKPFSAQSLRFPVIIQRTLL